MLQAGRGRHTLSENWNKYFNLHQKPDFFTGIKFKYTNLHTEGNKMATEENQVILAKVRRTCIF